jgi:hypothetical protein
MVSYATRDDLEAFLEDGLPAGYSDDYFDKVLEKASADVDDVMTGWYRLYTNELKMAVTSDPLVWIDDFHEPWQAGIVQATCAQAEYRLAKGDQFFVEHQIGGTRRSAEGLRININPEPRFGPKAREALRRSGVPILGFAGLR